MLSHLPVIDRAIPVALPAGMVAVLATELQPRAGELAGERDAVLAMGPGTLVTFPCSHRHSIGISTCLQH